MASGLSYPKWRTSDRMLLGSLLILVQLSLLTHTNAMVNVNSLSSDCCPEAQRPQPSMTVHCRLEPCYESLAS